MDESDDGEQNCLVAVNVINTDSVCCVVLTNLSGFHCICGVLWEDVNGGINLNEL